MSDLRVTNLRGRTAGSAPNLPDGVVVNDTTQSTSTNTGSVIISGGVGIAKSLHVGGNVSVGGTLTYEDVKNIDSIGIITGRSDMNIQGNATIAGILTATTFSGIEADKIFEGNTEVETIDPPANTYSIDVTASGSSAYTLSGNDRNGSVSGNNAPVTANVGDTLNFVVNASGHPFYIRVSDGGANVSTPAATNQGSQSGTVSWIPNTAGTYYYQCGNHAGMIGTITVTGSHIKMTTEGGERVRVGPAGQIGLGGANYGTSGQLLTSGGSGSAPTWTTVSSAPEVSGTANGAIAAGKPVIANADGSIGQVKYSYTALSPYQYTTYDTTITGNDAIWTKVGYDSTNNQLLYFWKSPQQSNAGKLTIGTPTGATTGTNVSLGSHQTLVTQVGDTGDIVWSKTSALGVAIYSYGSGIFVKAFTSDGTTITTGTELNICGNGSSLYPTISWDESSDKFLVVVGDNADNSNYAEAYVVSHSGTTLTKGSAVTVKTSQAKGADLAYDSDNNRHLLTYADQSDSDKICARIITVSGTVPTVNAETKGTRTVANTRGVYIPGSSKFVTVYGTGSTGYGRVVTISGTIVTLGTESSAIPSGISGTNYGNMQLDADYDPGLEKVMVAYVDSSTRSSYCVLTPDTSNNTISNVGAQGFVRNGSASLDVSVVYAPYWQLNGFSARRGSSAGVNNVYWNLTTTSRATNVTGENYLGVANASYTNGQTASIRVSGATQDNQSGLTPGQNYFVQNDGTIGLTAANPNVYAGTAVSSTQLLVGKASSFGVSPWVTVASHTGSSTNPNQHLIYEDFANQSYKRYKLIYFIESSGSHLNYIGIQVKEGNAWKSQSGSYTFIRSTRRSNSTTDQNQTNENRFWIVTESVKYLQGEITFYNPNGTTYFKNFCNNCYPMMDGTSTSSQYNFQFFESNGAYKMNTNPIQGIRFYHGTISGGLTELDWKLLAAP